MQVTTCWEHYLVLWISCQRVTGICAWNGFDVGATKRHNSPCRTKLSLLDFIFSSSLDFGSQLKSVSTLRIHRIASTDEQFVVKEPEAYRIEEKSALHICKAPCWIFSCTLDVSNKISGEQLEHRRRTREGSIAVPCHQIHALYWQAGWIAWVGWHCDWRWRHRKEATRPGTGMAYDEDAWAQSRRKVLERTTRLEGARSARSSALKTLKVEFWT